MQYFDIRETDKSWFELDRLFNNNKFFPLTNKPRLWTTQQQLDYLESLYYGNPTKSWFVQETKVGHWVLKYGHEQFYTLLDFENDLLSYNKDNWLYSVANQSINIRIIRPSVSEQDVQEVIRRYLSE